MKVMDQKLEELLELKKNYKEINNRFGKISINLDKKIYFHYGILGWSGNMNFCLTQLPNEKNSLFKILQSSDDDNLAFITLPIAKDHNGKYPFIDNADIENCCKELEISEENLVVLLIALFKQEEGKKEGETKVFVNVRAPLIIDVSKCAGIQYVFSNNKYLVRQEL